jgi:hypothetical protein
MKHVSKFHKMSALLGASLLMVTACAPDSRTQSGSTQPAPIERSPDNSAAANANEASAPALPGFNSNAQPAAASAVSPAFASPLLTPTPEPTAEPRSEIEFTGPVEAIASDMWVVGGRTLVVTAATEIKPGLAIGTQAKVHAVPQTDGSLWAREIESAAGDVGNGNGNSNDNGNGNGNGNSNDDNGNGNVNSNDNNGNDDTGNSNVNSNDDNSNDDHGDNGNVNSNDNNGNSNDDKGNDDHGGNDNGNGNHS